jgi:hypothetical protein
MPLIYRIAPPRSAIPYYGSTTHTLAERKENHRQQYRLWSEKKEGVGCCSSFLLFAAHGFENCVFEVVEQMPDDISSEQLRWRERHYTDNNQCVNVRRPIATAEEIAETQRKGNLKRYWENHAENLAKAKEYYEANRDKCKQKSLDYYYANTEKQKANFKAWKEKNIEKYRAYQKEYQVEYRRKKREEQIARENNGRNTDVSLPPDTPPMCD